MKKAHLLIGAVLLMSGCGDHFNGTYTGTETYQNLNSGFGGQQASPSGPVTITLSGDDSGRSVNWVGQFGSGSGKGTSSGNSISGLTMSMNDTGTTGFGMQGQAQAATNYNMQITVDDSQKLTAQGTGIGSSTPSAQGQFGGFAQQGVGATRTATAQQSGSN